MADQTKPSDTRRVNIHLHGFEHPPDLANIKAYITDPTLDLAKGERVKLELGKDNKWYITKQIKNNVFLAVISGHINMLAYRPGCDCNELDNEECQDFQAGLTNKTHVYWYSFSEVYLRHRCIDTNGIEKDCTDQDAEIPQIVMNILPNGRIGIIPWTKDRANTEPEKIPAVNLWEVIGSNSGPGGMNHHAQPAYSIFDCQVDENQPHYLNFFDVHNALYGALFNAVPPGAVSPITNAHVFNYIVEMHEFSQNGILMRYFVAPGVHSGAC